MSIGTKYIKKNALNLQFWKKNKDRIFNFNMADKVLCEWMQKEQRGSILRKYLGGLLIGVAKGNSGKESNKNSFWSRYLYM